MSSVRFLWLLSAMLALASLSVARAQEAEKADEHRAGAASSAADSHAHGAANEHGHAAGHAAGHDDTDLGHGNAGPGMNDPTEWRFDLSLFSFVVFLVLLAALTKFAWAPIATALQRREETIARQIEEAKLASEKGAMLLTQYEARLAAATDEARQIVAGARKDAELAKDRIVAEAREGAQKERDRAVADINVAKNQALDEIAQRSVQTAVSLASQIIRREVRPQEHEALIGEAMGKFAKMN